jgi:hypothetical protein
MGGKWNTPGPLSREGSLSCHTYCDTGPRVFRSHPKNRPIQSPLTTRKGMWMIYSNPDPHQWRFMSFSKTTKKYKFGLVICVLYFFLNELIEMAFTVIDKITTLLTWMVCSHISMTWLTKHKHLDY